MEKQLAEDVVFSAIRGSGFAVVRLPRGHTVLETWRVVDTDNFGSDYPDENFVSVGIKTEVEAQRFADAANKQMGSDAQRFLKVVQHFEIVYTLQPGFEP